MSLENAVRDAVGRGGTRLAPYDAGELVSRSLSGRMILLATDGSPAADAATRMAARIAGARHAVVSALAVVDTRPAPLPAPLDLALKIADGLGGPAARREQQRALRERIAATVGQPIEWPVRLRLGAPADVIARAARRGHAALIVMGLRRHGIMDRVIRDETTLGVMRAAGCPVLGVAAEATDLPRRVLVALDFGRASVKAALAARQLVAVGGVMTLAYVHPMLAYPPGDGEGVLHTMGVEAAFDWVARQLEGSDVTVDRVVLHHERPASIASLLLEYADGAHTDLIAMGSARHGRVDRLLLGSVSTELVRDGRRSMFVVPPS